jgi:hypothetical protein
MDKTPVSGSFKAQLTETSQSLPIAYRESACTD